MTPEELLDQTAGAIAEAIANKQVSAVEMTEAAIARIEARDGPINAVVVRDFDRAIAAAQKADARIARGERAPLLGVPMTVKESHDVAGLPKTWGFEDFKTFRPKMDSVGVKRLKAAGAIVLGKTNIPVGLADWQANNPIYGRTSNPWDLSRSPGGSSGGAAAALAARMVPLEFGSDIGGSIRVPAVFCGVYGHKPSFGIIPSRGEGRPGEDGAEPPIAVTGPLARSAADLEIALNVLAGPDEDHAIAHQLTLPPARGKRLADYRVLILDRHPAAKTDSEIIGALDALAAKLAATGARVARQSEHLPDLRASHEAYMPMMLSIMLRDQPDAPSASASEYLSYLDVQARICRQWAALFKEYDVVLAPALGGLAFRHDDEPDQTRRRIEIDGAPTLLHGTTGVAGHGDISQPAGDGRARWPLEIRPAHRHSDRRPLS